MHKHKKVLTSALALLLCFLTVFSCAFADGYTQQQATPGYPKPPVFSTGGSGSSKTTYNSCITVGYRFTCYRSTDYEEALKSGVSGKDLDAYLTKHDGQGKQLGISFTHLPTSSLKIWQFVADSLGGVAPVRQGDHKQIADNTE